MQQTKVKTDVVLGCRFPLDVLIATLCTYITIVQCIAAIAAGDIIGSTCLATPPKAGSNHCLVKGITGGVRDFLVTSLTPRITEFQVVQPLQVFHKVLFADSPTGTYRWERTILVVMTEAARTITTYGQRCQILVCIGVVHLSEE